MSIDEAHQVILQAGVDLPAEKKFYFNGFTCGISPMDVAIVLQESTKPIATLHCSHTAAKSLVVTLGQLIATFEKDTEREILTVDRIRELQSRESP